MRRAIIAAALAVTMLAAGCAGDGDEDGEAKVARSVMADSDAKPSVTTLQEVCRGRTRLTKAAPYEGAGGHPAMFFRPGTGDRDPKEAYIPLFPGPRTVAEREVLQPTDFAAVQIVGCLDRVSEKPAGKMCDFDIGTPTPLYTGTFRYTLRATRTGEVLGETALESAPVCPGGANVSLIGGEPKVYSGITEAQYLPLAYPFLYWNGQQPRPQLAR